MGMSLQLKTKGLLVYEIKLPFSEILDLVLLTDESDQLYGLI